MKRYKFSYQSYDCYDNMVTNCHFMMRCTPCNTAYQRVDEHNMYLLTSTDVQKDLDCFGNVIHYGVFKTSHDLFVVASSGVVTCEDQYRIEDRAPLPIFTSPTHLTQTDGEISTFNKLVESGDRSPLEIALSISAHIHFYLKYESGVTTVTTTAIECFKGAKGVCQDYSHMLIAMCRERGILARYVAGFVVGTGESHAWVEVWSDGAWYGIDPTYNKLIEDGYIKLSHGRDAADCSIIRGMRRGVTNHTSQIRVIVEPIECNSLTSALQFEVR